MMSGQSMEGRTKIRSHQRIKTIVLMFAGLCVAVSLTACGGGGGTTVVVDPGPVDPVDPPVMPSDESLALPSGHGLSAGEIRLAPGGSVERGNVVVSCPAGGAACVVTVTEDGTASYLRNGGVPTVVAWGYSRDNPTAEDLLDHWNDPQTLRSALGLSAVDTSDAVRRKAILKSLLDNAGGSPDKAGSRFRNIRPADIEIIGEKNGITYGQWKGGPAGTLNIEFDYRPTPLLNSDVRAAIERAGKTWSYHVLNDFGSYSIPSGESVRDNLQLDENLSTDGLLVFVDFSGDCHGGAACASHTETYGDGRYFYGLVTFVGKSDEYIADPYAVQSFMVHELGHVLDHFRIWQLQGGTPPITFEDFPVDPYINFIDGTYDGPRARAANGGNPVPFRRYKEGDFFADVPVGTPGAIVDYGHPGGCVNSVMAYPSPDCGDRVVADLSPTTFDFAVLADKGYILIDAATASNPETYGWGAWGRYSAWGVGAERIIRAAQVSVLGPSDVISDRLRVGADAFGVDPGMSLTENVVLTGTATWSGSLLGVDLGRAMLPPVFGDAVLQVDLLNLDGTARFDNLTVFVENKAQPFRAHDLEYAIQVTGNSFSDADSRIGGGFFGPAHEEMAGVLHDRTPSVNLIAGFGGNR